jgi:hypothetical protein
MKISLKSLTLIGLSVACLSMASHSASAAIVTVPTGLNPGDTYYLAFVTAGTITGTSTNIADYNAFAQSQATGAGLEHHFGVSRHMESRGVNADRERGFKLGAWCVSHLSHQ